MTGKPDGRVVLLTGAAGGLGTVMTAALIQAGHSIAALDRDAGALKKLSALHDAKRLLPIVADIADVAACAAAVEKTVAQFGRIDALINNAGIGMSSIRPDAETRHPQIEELSAELWDRFFAVNVRAALLLTKAAVPHMRKARWGRIVNNTTSYRTMLRERGCLSADPADVRLFSRHRRWCRFRVPDDDRSNRHAACGQLQCCFSVGRSQPALSEADPAGAQSGAAGGQHQVFRGQSTVLDSPRTLRHARNQNERGHVIENMEIRIGQQRVEMWRQRRRRGCQHMRLRRIRYAGKQRLVTHHAERPRLLVDGAGRLNGRVDQRPQRLFIDRLGGEFAHRAPRIDCFPEVHAPAPPMINCRGNIAGRRFRALILIKRCERRLCPMIYGRHRKRCMIGT
jgi:hypothetical protein